MQNLLLLSVGGALGAILRYAVSGIAVRLLGAGFPWGTLIANTTGCFVIGVVWAVSEETNVSAGVRLFVLTGILGAFTTFSTFGLETINLIRDGEIVLGLTNAAVSNVAGLAAVVCGMLLGRLIVLQGN